MPVHDANLAIHSADGAPHSASASGDIDDG